MTQADAVVATVERHGGVALLSELNRQVFHVEGIRQKTKTHCLRCVRSTLRGVGVDGEEVSWAKDEFATHYRHGRSIVGQIV